MTNVSSLNLQTELTSIMELLAKTAISEIIKLFDVHYTALRLEVIRKDDENEELKRKLLEVEEELTCVRMRCEIDNAVPDRTSYSIAHEAGNGQGLHGAFTSDRQQSSREDPCRLQVKEERHADMCWIQQTDTVRTDTTDAEGLQELPREPVAFRQLLLNLKLKEEHEERQEGQEEVRMRQEEEGRMAPGGSVRGDGQTQGGMHDWSGPQQWTLFAQEESNTDEDFLPLLPRIEQAIGYFHSNPISPENQGPPEMPLPPPTGSGTSVEAAGVSLTTHMAATPPQGRRLCRRPVVCLVCHQQLPSEVELVKHMRSHPGKRPYACSICGMHLAQKSSLRTHERLHSGLRPYRCPYCAKDYTLSHHLKRHMRTHLRDHATKDLRFYKDRPT